jgi:hypothetical protein
MSVRVSVSAPPPLVLLTVHSLPARTIQKSWIVRPRRYQTTKLPKIFKIEPFEEIEELHSQPFLYPCRLLDTPADHEEVLCACMLNKPAAGPSKESMAVGIHLILRLKEVAALAAMPSQRIASKARWSIGSSFRRMQRSRSCSMLQPRVAARTLPSSPPMRTGLASLLGIYGATVGAGVGEPDRSICSSPRTRHGASFESEYAAVNTEG